MVKEISRRQLLKGIAAGAGAGLSAFLMPRIVHAYGEYSNQRGGYTSLPTEQLVAHAAKPTYPITTTVDVGSSPDPERAAKARKLAEYVITRKNHPGVIFYKTFQFDRHQQTEAVVVIDGMRYSVVVNNFNEELKRLPDGRNLYTPDAMKIYFRPDGTGGEKYKGNVTDDGLDGRVNGGVLPIGVGVIRIKGVGSDITDSLLGRKFNDKERKGTQHRERFQEIRDAIVNLLLEFYETPKK